MNTAHKPTFPASSAGKSIVAHQRYVEAYRQWLTTLNYCHGLIYHSPRRLASFFQWLEDQGIEQLCEITPETLQAYFFHLKTIPHQRKATPLKTNTIRMHLQTLRRFSRYLDYVGQPGFTVPRITLKDQPPHPAVLSIKEIKKLYAACESNPLGERDRAMLAVYYGCGLRKSEGAALLLEDVLLDRNLLFVRKGKNYRQRYVPISAAVRDDLVQYIGTARGHFLKGESGVYPSETECRRELFINRIGKPLQAPAMADRFKRLMELAGIEKNAGHTSRQASLHTLRHSIATHLLRQGLSVENIAVFLGHSSLESTQIYTHLRWAGAPGS